LRLRESQQTSSILLQSTIHPTVAFKVQVLTNILEELDIDQVHPIAFAASSDPDALYLHGAMQQPDTDQFIKALGEETQAHEDNHHWEVVTRDTISQRNSHSSCYMVHEKEKTHRHARHIQMESKVNNPWR
jgi:hypothetical protein